MHGHLWLLLICGCQGVKFWSPVFHSAHSQPLSCLPWSYVIPSVVCIFFNSMTFSCHCPVKKDLFILFLMVPGADPGALSILGKHWASTSALQIDFQQLKRSLPSACAKPFVLFCFCVLVLTLFFCQRQSCTKHFVLWTFSFDQ